MALLAVMGWGFCGSLVIQINSLNAHLHESEIEKEQLQKEIFELKNKILENVTIRIGVTEADDDYNRTERFFEEIVEREVNEYCSKMNYGVKFDFVVKNNKGLSYIALQNLQEFKEMSINIIIGHPWSAHCYVSMMYVNKNNMLLFSSSSQSSQLARSGDNLLRMYPVDSQQGLVIAEMLRSLGIRVVIVMQRGDMWADGIYKVLEEFPKRGGVILSRIRYDPECTDFRGHLSEMEGIAKEAIQRYGKEHVAVELISFSEGVKILKQARECPSLYSLYWFGSDYTAGTWGFQALIGGAPDEAAHLRVFSPLLEPTRSQLYLLLNERYSLLFSEPLDLDMASRYDIAWIIVKAVLVARTIDVKRLLEIIPSIASTFFGASGWCKLDENGDRETADYGIYGYGYLNNTVTRIKYGSYDGRTGEVSWFLPVEPR